MVAIIIVTHNSAAVLPRCLSALERQTMPPDMVVLVDSGSSDASYLQPYSRRAGFSVFLEKNIGFSRANNIGYRAVSHRVDFVLFLNPDAFPEPDSIQLALTFLANNTEVGCVGGRLLGFDDKSGQPTGCLDSTGVFRKWYGCWYDRSQGELENGQHMAREDVPAACGAFLFCRKRMLDQTALIPGRHAAVFDPDFFLYKEDIELCLRIRKAGWRIVYLPEVIAYHCRGWKKNRQEIRHRQRLTAAQSELLLYRKHPSIYMLWALVKYALVRWLRI